MQLRILFMLLLLPTTAAWAETLIYTLTGTLPPSSSMHSQVADGESFSARFLIDGTTPDLDQINDSVGIFVSAVDTGGLTFSGGYESTINFSQSSVFVSNDVPSPTGTVDAVQVTNSDQLLVQSADFSDADTLASDALPGAGVSIVSAPDPYSAPTYQFQYTDA